MKKEGFLFVFLTIFFTNVLAQRPCNARAFSGVGMSTICVCNSTYCDDISPLGKLQADEFVVYVSSQSGSRFERQTARFTNQTLIGNTESRRFIVNSSITYQKIFGFGGAFTDSVGINLNTLSPLTRRALLKQYYSRSSGIGYTFGRVPMASCDFSTRIYSYDDVENDFELKHFNLTEEDYILKIPYIKDAKSLVSPDEQFQLFSTPWSAPGWMKTNGQMQGGGSLKGEVNGKYYQIWAQYFIKFFEAYKKENVTFWGLSIQNEPTSGAIPNYKWQTMLMTAFMERDFLGSLLGPALKASNLTKDVKVMIYGDDRWGMNSYVNRVMEDSKAASYVNGVAFHWYENFFAPAFLVSEVHKKHPDLFLLASEACAGYLPLFHGVILGDWSRAALYANDIIEDISNYANGWIDWNLALNEKGGPTWCNNVVDAPIIVNGSSDEFYKQPMFYALGHFSKFVRPGSYRVQMTDNKKQQHGETLTGLAFSTPAQQLVIVLHNAGESSEKIAIEDTNRPGKSIAFVVPEKSISTVVFNQKT